MKINKLWIKFWWPVYSFAIAFVTTSLVLILVEFTERIYGCIICLDMIFSSAYVGTLIHRISLINDVTAGYVVSMRGEDVESDNELRKVYYEYLNGYKYEDQEVTQ